MPGEQVFIATTLTKFNQSCEVQYQLQALMFLYSNWIPVILNCASARKVWPLSKNVPTFRNKVTLPLHPYPTHKYSKCTLTYCMCNLDVQYRYCTVGSIGMTVSVSQTNRSGDLGIHSFLFMLEKLLSGILQPVLCVHQSKLDCYI